MRILVTGGGGFVGGYIIHRLLQRGYAVRSFGRSPQPRLEVQGVEVVRGDLSNAENVRTACRGVDAVFHVAAKAGVWGSWESYYNANVIGTRHVVDSCRSEGIGRLVYTSTPSVVFSGKAIRSGGQDMPYGRNWLCHYAQTKAIAEQEALSANTDSFRVVALRPHLIFGPGDPHLLPRVVGSILEGRLKIVGNGRNRVDVAYVEDVAAAHLNAFDALEKRQCAGQAYFIAQGEPVQLWPWLNQILEGLGHPPLTGRIALPMAYALGGVAEGIWKLFSKKGEPPITRFVAVELAKDHYFDPEPAQRDLNYFPETPMDYALKKTIIDLKSRGF